MIQLKTYCTNDDKTEEMIDMSIDENSVTMLHSTKDKERCAVYMGSNRIVVAVTYEKILDLVSKEKCSNKMDKLINLLEDKECECKQS
jgi:hypothetical protein